MEQKLYAMYDGQTFTPEGKVNLIPNKRYLLRIESKQKTNKIQDEEKRLAHIRSLRGKYRDKLTPSDEFAKNKLKDWN